MGVPISLANALPEMENVDAVLDEIIGYSLNGNPLGFTAAMIHWTKSQKTPIVALDTPSGKDLTTGKLYDPIIKANATLTLAMPKKGLFASEAKEVVGELYVGDISVPQELYHEKGLGLQPGNIFRYSDIVRVY